MGELVFVSLDCWGREDEESLGSVLAQRKATQPERFIQLWKGYEDSGDESEDAIVSRRDLHGYSEEHGSIEGDLLSQVAGYLHLSIKTQHIVR